MEKFQFVHITAKYFHLFSVYYRSSKGDILSEENLDCLVGSSRRKSDM